MERKSEAVKDLTPMVMLDLMEYDHGIWRVDVSVDQFLADQFELKALYNGTDVRAGENPAIFRSRFSGKSHW